MKKLICILVLLSVGLFARKIKVTPEMERLMSDKEYFWTNYTFKETLRFFSLFKKNRFTKGQKFHIYFQSKKNGVSIIMVCSKVETETSRISGCTGDKRHKWLMDRVMGYGAGVKRNGVYIFRNFYTQIRCGTKALATYHKSRRFKAGKTSIKIHFGKVRVYPKNKATYNLYVYCPFYGKYMNYGTPNIGNKLFVRIYQIYKRKWVKVNGRIKY